MTPLILVRFCVGCGHLCDEIHPESGHAEWIDAHAYFLKYGFHWNDLNRIDDACPPCARVLAYARRGALPETAEAATRS